MKKILFLLSLPLFVVAQPTIVESKIEAVTVYSSGALVERTANVLLTQGKNELIFRGLAEVLDKNSIQLSTSENLPIQSIIHQMSTFYSRKEEVEKIKQLNDQLSELASKLRIEKNNLKVYEREEEMLMKNQVVGGTYSGLKAADLKESVAFYRERMQEILMRQLTIQDIIKKHENDIKVLNGQLTIIQNSETVKSSEIVVVLESSQTKKLDFRLMYFVENAAWKPEYDVMVKDVSSPIQLRYKAAIYQYSGEDWNNVQLTLSNALPKKKGIAPELKTWFWGVTNDYSDYINMGDVTAIVNNQVTGTVRDASDNSPLPGVTIRINGTSLGTQTDVNGFYRLTIPPDLIGKKPVISYSYIGMVTQEYPFNKNVMDVQLNADEQSLQEVVVVGYGVQKKKEVTAAATVLQGRVAGLNIKSVEIKRLAKETDGITSQEFSLNQKYSVLSNGKTYTAELKELQIPAEFEYRAIPKIDLDAFLTARIIEWGQFNLLKGDMNLIVEGRYIGKSTLDVSNEDTLTISLGRDKSVLIKRSKVKTYQKKQVIGTSKVDNYAYEIDIRNLKKHPISISIEDQFPVSQYKQVEVFDKQAENAIETAETGKLTWKMVIPPNESKKLPFKFSVKYPKNEIVEVN